MAELRGESAFQKGKKKNNKEKNKKSSILINQ
jgi:hypothetical protein